MRSRWMTVPAMPAAATTSTATRSRLVRVGLARARLPGARCSPISRFAHAGASQTWSIDDYALVLGGAVDGGSNTLAIHTASNGELIVGADIEQAPSRSAAPSLSTEIAPPRRARSTPETETRSVSMTPPWSRQTMAAPPVSARSRPPMGPSSSSATREDSRAADGQRRGYA